VCGRSEEWSPGARAFWEIIGTNQDEWRARFVDDFKQEERQLAAFVADEDSRDTLHWIVGLLQSFLGLALSVPPEFVTQIDEAAFAQLNVGELGALDKLLPEVPRATPIAGPPASPARSPSASRRSAGTARREGNGQ
jgi:hypothetical protein